MTFQRNVKSTKNGMICGKSQGLRMSGCAVHFTLDESLCILHNENFSYLINHISKSKMAYKQFCFTAPLRIYSVGGNSFCIQHNCHIVDNNSVIATEMFAFFCNLTDFVKYFIERSRFPH